MKKSLFLVTIFILILSTFVYAQLIDAPVNWLHQENNRVMSREYRADNNTVALYHFDEGKGNITKDSTKNNNHGTLHYIASFSNKTAPLYRSTFSISLNNPQLDQNIPTNRAYISVPDDPSLNLTGDFTLEAWVKRTSKNTGIVLEKGITQSYPVGGYSLEVYGIDGHLRLQKINSNYVVSNVTVDHDKWTHVAITNNATNGEVKFYKNGVLMQTVIDTNPILPTNEPLYIGYAIENNWGWAPFFGFIDEVRISNKIRTPEEFNVLR